jgi:hypothetical protein
VRSTAPASTRSRLRCGAGRDTLAAESQGLPMIVAADCETVRMDTGRVGLRTPLATLGAVVGRLDAGCTGGRPPCRVRVELRVAAAPGQRLRGRWAAGRLLGSVSAQIRPGRRVRRLGVRLEPRARRLLARRGVLLVRVLVRRDVDIPPGEFDSAGFPIRLHAP